MLLSVNQSEGGDKWGKQAELSLTSSFQLTIPSLLEYTILSATLSLGVSHLNTLLVRQIHPFHALEI